MSKITKSKIRQRYTKVSRFGDSWATFLQIDHQGFCVVDGTTKYRANWFRGQLVTALDRLLARYTPKSAPEFQKAASDAIKHALKTHGVTQRELARRCGWNPKFVSKILTGKEDITLEIFFKITQAIGAEIHIIK